MSNEQDNEKQTELERLFGDILRGLNSAERQAFLQGLNAGINSNLEALNYMERINPGAGSGILDGLKAAFQSRKVRAEITKRRRQGKSAEFLEQQIKQSLSDAISIIDHDQSRHN